MKRLLIGILKGILYVVLFIAIVIGIRVILGEILSESVPPPLTAQEKALRSRALELHHQITVVDTHNDVPTWMLDFGFDLGMDGDEPGDTYPFLYHSESPLNWIPGKPHGENVATHTDLNRIREGGLDVEFFSIWAGCGIYQAGAPGQTRQYALDMIEVLQKSVNRYPKNLEFASTVQNAERIVSGGKLAAFMGLEGGHIIEDNLDNLGHFYELGVRYMTLTHNCNNKWADSATDEPFNNGLTDFGREVVLEMNRLGMMVDVSHVSEKTLQDALEVSRAPVIASHSNARAIADHPRNLTDDQLRAIAAKGGVVVVNFMTMFLDPEIQIWKLASGWHWFLNPRTRETTPLSLLIDHIDHIVKVAGIDHVGGVGSDFDGTPFLPKGLQDMGDLPNITVELLRRGYSDEEIRKIMGGNVLRLLEEVETVAAQL